MTELVIRRVPLPSDTVQSTCRDASPESRCVLPKPQWCAQSRKSALFTTPLTLRCRGKPFGRAAEVDKRRACIATGPDIKSSAGAKSRHSIARLGRHAKPARATPTLAAGANLLPKLSTSTSGSAGANPTADARPKADRVRAAIATRVRRAGRPSISDSRRTRPLPRLPGLEPRGQQCSSTASWSHGLRRELLRSYPTRYYILAGPILGGRF